MKRWISCVCALVLLGTMCAGSLSAAESAFPLGDVNADSEVDSSDARLLLQSTVGFQTLSGRQQFLGDVNMDGEINSSDARLLLQASVEAAELPVCGSPYPSRPAQAATFTLAASAQPEFPQRFDTREELLAFAAAHLSDEAREELDAVFDEAFFEENAAVLVNGCSGPQKETLLVTDGTLLLTVMQESGQNPSGVIHAGVIGLPRSLLEGRILYVESVPA